MITYERQTDDLRQVKKPITQHLTFTTTEGWVRQIDGYETTVQRKWLIQDGEPFDAPYWQQLAPNEAEWPLSSGPCTITLTDEQQALMKQGVIVTSNVAWQATSKSVVKLKEEWRDLPIVDAKDV